MVRFFLSAGRGGFGLSPAECVRPALYVVVQAEDNIAHGDSDGEGNANQPMVIAVFTVISPQT